MIGKAYIVANKQQEMTVLVKLEREGVKWRFKSKPTEWVPTRDSYSNVQFPYVLFNDDGVTWGEISELEDNHEIVYDGRKEECLVSLDSFENSIDKKELIEILKGFDLIKEKDMSEKYVVSQEFMNKLEECKNDIRHEWSDKKDDGKRLNSANIIDLERITEGWWLDTEISYKESNNRLIAIIRWVNGEDVFEVEKPKKWVIRSTGLTNDNEHYYVSIGEFLGLKRVINTFDLENATKFDTKEEAESWANSHQEVIEVVDV